MADRKLNYRISLTDDFSRNAMKTQQEMKKMAAEGTAMKNILVDAGKGVLALTAAAATMRVLKAPVGYAADMQAAMLGVRAELIGADKDAITLNHEMQALRQTAMQVQGVTMFDATQILELEQELLKGGATLTAVAGKQGAAMAAAMIAQYEGGMTPAQAGQYLIGIATPFNLAGDQFGYLADQISRASAASVSSFAEMAEGAKYAAPRMAALNVDIEDMLALQAMLSQQGAGGSMGGTSLAAMYGEGVRSGFIGRAEAANPAKLIDKLKESVRGLDEVAAQNKLFELGFGERSMKAVQGLINQDFPSMRRQMRDAASLTEKMTVTFSGFAAQVGALKGTSTSVLAEIFQDALPPMTKAVELLNRMATGVGDVTGKYPQIGKVITAAAGTGIAAAGLYGAASLTKAGMGLYAATRPTTIPITPAYNPATGTILRTASIPGQSFLGALRGSFSGLLGTGGGILKGKAIEAATGVQSVYVTNQIDEHKIAAAAAQERNIQMAAYGGRLNGLMRMIPVLGAVSIGLQALVALNDAQNQAAATRKSREENNLNLQLSRYVADLRANAPGATRVAGMDARAPLRGETSLVTNMHGVRIKPEGVDYSRTSVLAGADATLLNSLPQQMKDAFSRANETSVQIPIDATLTNFAADWKEHQNALWSRPYAMQDYADIYRVLGAEKETRVYLSIDMKQEQSSEGIKNKEFIVKVASGERAKVASIRGDYIKSFARNF